MLLHARFQNSLRVTSCRPEYIYQRLLPSTLLLLQSSLHLFNLHLLQHILLQFFNGFLGLHSFIVYLVARHCFFDLRVLQAVQLIKDRRKSHCSHIPHSNPEVQTPLLPSFTIYVPLSSPIFYVNSLLQSLDTPLQPALSLLFRQYLRLPLFSYPT